MANMKLATKEQITLVEHIRDNYQGKSKLLTPWEVSFTEDILDRYVQYGERLFLSKKQVDRLIVIGATLT